MYIMTRISLKKLYKILKYHANIFLSWNYALTKLRCTEKKSMGNKRRFLRVASGTRLGWSEKFKTF